MLQSVFGLGRQLDISWTMVNQQKDAKKTCDILSHQFLYQVSFPRWATSRLVIMHLRWLVPRHDGVPPGRQGELHGKVRGKNLLEPSTNINKHQQAKRRQQNSFSSARCFSKQLPYRIAYKLNMVRQSWTPIAIYTYIFLRYPNYCLFNNKCFSDLAALFGIRDTFTFYAFWWILKVFIMSQPWDLFQKRGLRYRWSRTTSSKNNMNWIKIWHNDVT